MKKITKPTLTIEESDWYIESAQAKDARKLAGMHKVSCLALYPSAEINISAKDIEAGRLDSEEKIELWRKRIENPNGKEKIWVAKEGERVIGFCYALKKEVQNEIYSIYLLPGHTGKGIGRCLMKVALKWLGKKKETMLQVATYNKNAIRFYEQLGFQKTGNSTEFSFTPLIPGKFIPLLEMVKPLASRPILY